MSECYLCGESGETKTMVAFMIPPSWTNLQAEYTCQSCFDNYEPDTVTFDEALAHKCNEEQQTLEALDLKR